MDGKARWIIKFRIHLPVYNIKEIVTTLNCLSMQSPVLISNNNPQRTGIIYFVDTNIFSFHLWSGEIKMSVVNNKI